jgi:hypothetical protein
MTSIHIRHRPKAGENFLTLVSPPSEKVISQVRLIKYTITFSGNQTYYGVFIDNDWLSTACHNREIPGSHILYLPHHYGTNYTSEMMDMKVFSSSDGIPPRVLFNCYALNDVVVAQEITANCEINLWLEVSFKD